MELWNYGDSEKKGELSVANTTYQYPNYTKEQHLTWEKLYTIQYPNLIKYAHETCLQCLDKLNLTSKTIPDLNIVSDYLNKSSGWKIKPVNEMVDYDVYFELLSQKYFPSTYFIRSPEEFEISKAPDIFHELIGHVSMLMDKSYGNFLYKLGLYAIQAPSPYKSYLLRLAWYTTEVGLIETRRGIKIFGASILSSIKEIRYAVENEQIAKFSFSLLDVLRMPYAYDSLQRCYFIFKNFEQLYSIVDDYSILTFCIEEARRLGSYKLDEINQELLVSELS